MRRAGLPHSVEGYLIFAHESLIFAWCFRCVCFNPLTMSRGEAEAALTVQGKRGREAYETTCFRKLRRSMSVSRVVAAPFYQLVPHSAWPGNRSS